MLQNKLLVYYRLMRIDKPIGTLLLLWPTLWALWLVSSGSPAPSIFVVFVLGVFLMRSAGCVINDYTDRQIDGYVQRTRHRPYPNNELNETEGKILFLGLALISFSLVLTLNKLAIMLSFVALLLVLTYPFMKRIIPIPQVVLGLAFSWAIPMVYAAVSNELPLHCWLLLLANVFWTVAYDTEYAMMDKLDDIKLELRSSAILFGRFYLQIIIFLQLTMLFFMLIIGWLNQLNGAFYFSLIITTGLFVYQFYLMYSNQENAYFRAFMNNNYVGLVLFLGFVFGTLS